MLIKIITIDLATGAIIKEENCNIIKFSSQKWLIKHLIWAFTNGYGIQMLNVNDKEPV
jgi:hypothetical protein